MAQRGVHLQRVQRSQLLLVRRLRHGGLCGENIQEQQLGCHVQQLASHVQHLGCDMQHMCSISRATGWNRTLLLL
jgi:hypothetical protein